MKLKALLLASLTACAMALPAATGGAGAPTLDPANDADHFGPPDSILFWSPKQKVAGFRNMDRIAWTRKIRPAARRCISLKRMLI